jgi:hypothetical protein
VSPSEEWYAVIDHEIEYGDMYLQPIAPRTVDLLRRMYRRGYGIHIVTARGHFGPLRYKIREITKSQLIKDRIPYDSLNFTKDKVETALELSLDYMIDDHPKYHDPLTAAGINSFLLDAPYNMDHPEKYWPQGKRVKTVYDYCKIIMDTHGYPNKMTGAQRAHVVTETVR